MKSLFIVLLVLLIASQAQATTYYVDDVNAVDDTNDGSEEEPWKTLPHIGDSRGGNTFAEGDTCYIKNYTGAGCYDGFLQSDDVVRSTYTKYINAPGHTPDVNWIYIHMSLNPPADKFYWFEGLTVVGDRLAQEYKIFWQGHHAVFKDMTITGDGYVEGEGIGFKSTDCDYIHFENCTFNGAVDESQGGEYHGINMVNCSDVNIIDCNFSRYALAVVPGGTATTGGCKRWTISGNIFHDLDSDGMYGSDWEDFDIVDNQFYNIMQPIVATLTGEYTYTHATRTLARITGDQFPLDDPVIAAPTNRPSLTSTANGLIPPIDTNIPLAAYTRYVPAIVTRTDANTLVISNAGGLDYGENYNDITKVEIYRDYHCDGIQTSDANQSEVLMTNVRIERNVLHDIRDIGMLLKAVSIPGHLGPFYVKNNLLYNNGRDVQVEDVNGLYFINNTMPGQHIADYNSGDGAGFKGICLFQQGTTIAQFYNNIMDAVSGDIDVNVPLHDNNIYYSLSLTSIAYTPGSNELDLASLSALKGEFTDYDNRDYSLKSDSNAVDAAWAAYAPLADILGVNRGEIPDIGAYEYVAGGVPSKATTPDPADEETGTSLTNDLSWVDGGSADNYNVYWGTDETPDSEELKGNQAGVTYDTDTMDETTLYYWRIDANNASGLTTGDVWSFTTETLTRYFIGSQ